MSLKVGTRVELVMTSDPHPGKLKSGEKGTVSFVDDAGTIHVDWDCGSKLGLIPGEDVYKVLAGS